MISKRSRNQKDLLANYKVEKTILVHALSCAPSDSVGRLVDVSQRERQRRVNNAQDCSADYTQHDIIIKHIQTC